ncbi:MAG: hypothetical protein V4639_20140 [Pseudomonadota bacterium]
MEAYTKSGALQFINYCIAKGLVNSNTGGGWKAAFSKIMEGFGPDDDLTGVDVQSEVLRYNNRHPGLLSPDSLNQYQKRVLLVLQEFAKYVASPTTYKGISSRPLSTNGKSSEKKSTPESKAIATVGTAPLVDTQQPKQITSAVTDTSLMMPFPLRPNFLAQIIIPRDLTKEEATRLCNFIQALSQDAPVAST